MHDGTRIKILIRKDPRLCRRASLPVVSRQWGFGELIDSDAIPALGLSWKSLSALVRQQGQKYRAKP